MEERSDLLTLLLFIAFSAHLSSAVKHTLEYKWTVETLGQFTAVGLLDGKEFVYYDNSTGNMTPNTEWFKEVERDSCSWQSETWDVAVQKDWIMDKLQALKGANQAKGGDTLQRVYGCEIDDDNTRGYDKSTYNGKDFISLNLDTKTWTVLDDRAESFTNSWNPGRKTAEDWTYLLTETCIECLQKYIPYSTMKEKGSLPEQSTGGTDGESHEGSDVGPDGWKTTITLMVVLVVAAAAAAIGFLMYKKKHCARLRSGYVGSRQSPEQ